MIQIILSAVSFFTGATVAVQSAVNGRLRAAAQNPIFASFASFGGGLLLLFVLLGAAHLTGIYSIPAFSRLLETRPWMWIGGLIGCVLVVGSIVIPKQIGFGSYFSMLVAGQLTGSVLADAIGFLGSEVHTPGLLRITGLALLIAGAFLLQDHKKDHGA